MPPSYDISQSVILFTKQYTHSKEIKKSNQNQWICDDFTTGDQQARNLNRILGVSQNSERHTRYLTWLLMSTLLNIMAHLFHFNITLFSQCVTHKIYCNTAKLTLIVLSPQMTITTF